MAEVTRTMSLASIEHGLPAVSQEAWTYSVSCLDEARARLLSSVWATGPTERAQAQYNIQMLGRSRSTFSARHVRLTRTSTCRRSSCRSNTVSGCRARTFTTAGRSSTAHAITASGRLGKSRWIEFQAQRGFWGDENQSRLGNWDFDDFEVGADGSFEIIASPRKQKGNWIELDPACGNITLMARDALYDWNSDVPMEVHIEHLGPGTGRARCA